MPSDLGAPQAAQQRAARVLRRHDRERVGGKRGCVHARPLAGGAGAGKHTARQPTVPGRRGAVSA